MKTITKLLWGIISAMVCVMYKIEANAKCHIAVKTKTYVAAACTHTVCSAMNVCGSTGNSSCNAAWQKETYADDASYFDYLITKYTSQVTGHSQICPPGYYVANCKVANGTTYYAGVDSYFASGLCTTVNCTPCLGGGTTMDGVGYNVYDEGRGFYQDSSYDDWIYVCSNYDAITDTYLNGCYMQRVGMSCVAETVYELYNDINDCFLPAPVELTDTTGTYTCGDASAYYE